MKVGRQAKIIELIHMHDVETQEELGDLLTAAGYRVTQATISRDIRELKLTKVPAEHGKQKYVAIQDREADLDGKYVRVLKDGFIRMDVAENILVVKTVSGMAMAVGAAFDALDVNGIVGCIAGDDTVFCAVRTSGEVEGVMKRLYKMME